MSWLLENTIVAGIAAGLVFLACKLFRPRPALAHVLWLLVLVKLVCPPLLRWSVVPPPVSDTEVRTSPPLVHTKGATTPPLVHTRVSDTKGGTALDWALLLAGLWAAGSALALLSVLRGLVRLRRLDAGGREAPARLSQEASVLADLLGVKTPRIRVVTGVASPFVFGFRRASLFWPEERPQSRGHDETRSVLAHELAHLKRKDHWVAWLEVGAIVALWWNPVLWLARARMRQQAELACDAWAVWAVPAARHAYAGALIDSLNRDSRALAAAPVLGAGPGARRAFERRLTMILKEDVPRRLSRWGLVPVAALGAVVLCGFTPAQEKRQEARSTRLERTVQDEVRRIINEELRRTLGKDYQVEDVRDVRRVVRDYLRAKSRRRAPAKRDTMVRERVRERDSGVDVQSRIRRGMREGLAEARREIRRDKDLAKLGLTDDVEKLVTKIMTGQGDVDLESFIGKAMRAGLKVAKKEIRQDKDLARLGLTNHVERLLNAVLGGEGDAGAAFRGLLGKAIDSGLNEARRDIRRDKNLQKLGIADNVERLLDSLGKGDKRDFGQNLEQLIRKAIQGSLKDSGIPRRLEKRRSKSKRKRRPKKKAI